MSLITSCPACGTMFRVVPDQLKISEGWVRCGHCAEVFDAASNFVDEAMLGGVPQQRPQDEQPTMPAPLGLRRPDASSRPDAWADPQFEREAQPTVPGELPTGAADLETRPAELATRPAELPTRPAELATGPAELGPRGSRAEGFDSSFFGRDSQLEPSPLDAPFVFRRSDLAHGGDSSVLPPPPRDSHYPVEEPEEEAAGAELEDLSFVRQARRKALWRRPLVRFALALLLLALAALLALQFAYQDRDRLARAQPQLRPALEWMCEQLQCTIGPPRQIESIVIESSGFSRLRNDAYRLAFTLRNTSGVEVAVPAMELTVTDAQDQPIVRRVLFPEELGVPGGVIAPGGEWSRSVGLLVVTPANARVAGYRLLAFYP